MNTIVDSKKKFTQAKLTFLKKNVAVSQIVAGTSDGSKSSTNTNFEEIAVTIHNGRYKNEDFSLDREGFLLKKHQSKVTDFFNDDQLSNIYNDELKQLISDVTACDKVLVLNHTRRSTASDNTTFNKPALTVHNDYTESSMDKNLQSHIKKHQIEIDLSSYKRIAILIIWRSCRGQVLSYPLALCDSTTVDMTNVLSVIRSSSYGENEVQLSNYDENNVWYYFPKMNADEIIIFRSSDTASKVKDRNVLHSAVDVYDGSTPRLSIESRCFVFYK